MPLRACRNELGLFSHIKPIAPKGGESMQLTLGGGGASVAGVLASPADFSTDSFNTQLDVGKRHTLLYARNVATSRPSGTDSDTGYVATLRPDGHFEIAGLPSGKYELLAKVHAPRMPNSCGMPIAIAAASKTFEIGEGSQLDLGSVELKVNDAAVVGQPAPALAGNTLDGKPASLADLRGKVVLLDFWASWCQPCRAQIPAVKKLWEAKSTGPSASSSFAVFGVNLDYTLKPAQDAAKEEKIPWPSIALPGWGESNPTLEHFGITGIPSLWLIDKEGKVIARDIPPEQLEAEVEKALR
jgi:thiol-disulfide isomerase/thioredoxin